MHPHNVVGERVKVDAGESRVWAAGRLAIGAEEPLDEIRHDVDDGLAFRALQELTVRPSHRYGSKGQLLLIETERGDPGQYLEEDGPV